LIGFVNRTNDYARYDHFDKAADAYQYEEFCGKGLRRINGAARADRQNFQHDSEANTGRDSAAGESAGVNHDESERQTCLANNDPMKQAHHLFARPEETLGFSKNIFQQDAIIELSPKENKDERGDEREDESFHELLYS
jgi:hypothetical protein